MFSYPDQLIVLVLVVGHSKLPNIGRHLYLNMKKRDVNHWEKGDHSGARFDLCTV